MTSKSKIGSVIFELASTDSTNQYASRLLANEDLPEGAVIRADFQTSGKGYSGNQWQSDQAKNLLMSVVLKPSFLTPARQFFLNQTISLAVADTVKKFAKKNTVKVKWPNDIICNDGKIAGILIENSIMGSVIQHSIVGIGLNVNQQQFHHELKNATSLFIISGQEWKIDNVLRSLCENIGERYMQLKSNHMEQIQKDYMKNLYRVEEESVFISNGKRFSGKIAGLTAEGKLIIHTGHEHDVYGFKEVEMVLSSDNH